MANAALQEITDDQQTTLSADERNVQNAATLEAISASQAMIEFETDGTILTANANFLAGMGYSLDEIQGKHHSMFVDAAYKESAEYREFWETLRSGKFQSGEFMRVNKAGEEVWLQASYNPLLDADGKAFKVVKIAVDITAEKKQKLKADADTNRLTQMVDNMPVNVMMADPEEFKINYINRTSVETLKTLEHLLPVKADDMLGQCIDIFHKNPSHQRGILGDPKNLPHQARIKVGNKTLDLLVTAIMDKTGKYIGPMLSWSVITNIVQMTDNFERHVKGVVQTFSSSSTELQASAQEMTKTAELTSQQSSSVASAAEQATTNVQTVASAAEELSSSIAEISSQVSKSSEIAQNAVSEADRTNTTVEGLAEAAQKIGDVVSLINDIAGQTNLLALNATIEAARAGGAGKGFAVVASEVKNLANQTAKATEEIGNQIGAIQGAAGEAVIAIKGIGGTIREINEIASSIASAVEEQGAATSEISRNVQEAATGTQEVTGTIAQVATAANETGQSAGQVLEASGELSKQSELLGNEVDKFLKEMKKI